MVGRHLIYPDWFPTSYDFVPKLKEDASGDDILTTGWDADIATRLWWNTMTNPDAWQGSFRQQSPYSGVAQDLQGRIQAENFDFGGQGFAYNDSEFNSWRSYGLAYPGEGGYREGWQWSGGELSARWRMDRAHCQCASCWPLYNQSPCFFEDGSTERLLLNSATPPPTRSWHQPRKSRSTQQVAITIIRIYHCPV